MFTVLTYSPFFHTHQLTVRQRYTWQMPECSSLKTMSMKGGDLVCFGEARHRVVCESGGGEGEGGPGTILPGHCQTLFVLGMGWD